MPILSEIGLYEVSERHVLTIRETIDFNEFSQIAKSAYDKIRDYARQNEFAFAGDAFVCYHNTDLAALDVSLGFPVAQLLPGNGRITGHTLPRQKTVSALFLGPYEESDPLMLAIMQWIETHGYTMQGEIYNHYLNDDNRPRNEILTKISIPVV